MSRDWLAPMLSTAIPDEILEATLDKYEVDDEVYFEQKANGDRRLVYVVDGEVIPLNRSGGPTTLPLQMISVLSSQQTNFAVDGELIGTGLHRRLWLFDMPWVPGMIDETTPFEHRRAALETLHAGLLLTAGGIDLLPCARTTSQKRLLRNNLRQRGAEGLIVKPADHVYVSGLSPNGTERRSWEVLKAKWRGTVDCFVTGLRIDGHDNIGLGLYDADGGHVDAGCVNATTGDGARIVRRYREIETGGGDTQQIVVEVTVLNVSNGGRLIQPTLPRLRDDKPAASCTTDQLAALRDDKTIITPTIQGGLSA